MIATTANIRKQIFHWVSIIIWLCIGCDSLISTIELENAQYFINQSDAKLTPILPTSLVLPALITGWRCVKFSFVLIGCCK